MSMGTTDHDRCGSEPKRGIINLIDYNLAVPIYEPRTDAFFIYK